VAKQSVLFLQNISCRRRFDGRKFCNGAKRFSKHSQTFSKACEKKFKPVRIILFGSRARGVVKKHSDYDILLVSDFFEGIDFTERCMLAYNLRRDISIAMDIICLTPEEYAERSKRPTIFQEIAREGKDITALA